MITIRNIVPKTHETFLVSKWLWSKWGTEKNLNYWVSWVESSTFTECIPQTFVALEEGNILGTVSLWRCDLQSRQDIFPWLGGLYVDESHRKKGIGAALQEHAFDIAIALGYDKLYMFTEINGYFDRFGWIYMEDIPNESGEMVKLFYKKLK